MDYSKLDDEQICLGHDEETDANLGGMMPPIVQTSLFRFNSFEELIAGQEAEHRNYVYSHGQNPTVDVIERKLAALERGDACKCFGTGMAAVCAVLLSLLKQGDHVVFVNNIYGPTMKLADYLQNFGISYDAVYDNDYDRMERAVRPQTKLIYFESPGTMMFHMTDIERIVDLAEKRGILTCIDNTWATPLYLKPLTLGVDISIHSCTKYIGGHSDVLAGAVIASNDVMEQIFYKAYMMLGGMLAPFDAWLLIRGLRTMPARLKQHHQDALKVAHFLDNHPKVRTVLHPAVHPSDKKLAEKYLTGYTGLFGFELRDGTFENVKRFINNLTLFRIGVSWGGVESQVISPNRGNNSDSLKKQNIPPGLIRLSIGLDGSERLIQDIDRALSSL